MSVRVIFLKYPFHSDFSLGNTIPAPQAVLQGEEAGLRYYYLYAPIEWEDARVMAAVPPILVGSAVADGPLPFGDILGLVASGTYVVGYIALRNVIPDGYVVYDGVEDLAAELAFWAQQMPGRVPLNPEHHVEHDVGTSPAATELARRIHARWPHGDGGHNDSDLDKIICYALVKGGQVLRHVIWAGTHRSGSGLPRGDLLWYQRGEHGGWEASGYPEKSLRTMGKVPRDLEGQGYRMERIDCESIDPPWGDLLHLSN